MAIERFAKCHECDWHGSRAELEPGDGPLDELCPECESDDTEWTDEEPVTADERLARTLEAVQRQQFQGLARP